MYIVYKVQLRNAWDQIPFHLDIATLHGMYIPTGLGNEEHPLAENSTQPNGNTDYRMGPKGDSEVLC